MPLLRELAAIPIFGRASQNKDVAPARRKRLCNRAADYASADDHNVRLFHGMPVYPDACRQVSSFRSGRSNSALPRKSKSCRAAERLLILLRAQATSRAFLFQAHLW